MTPAAIIIPVHNRRATTLACLRHLQAQGDLDWAQAVVIDDGSSDGTGDAVASEFPRAVLLHGDGGLWWTGGIALGMRHAFEVLHVEIVCWLNDDCLPAPGTLRGLADFIADHPGTLVAPRCVDTGGTVIPNGFRGRHRVVPKSGEIWQVDGLSGFCVALPRAVWDRLGPPDATRFPHYFGDTAYTLAATCAGFQSTLLGRLAAEVTAHCPPPTRIRDRCEPRLGVPGNFRRVFVDPKSPFRLATQFHHLRLKYGLLPGTVLAAVRTVQWLAAFALRL